MSLAGALRTHLVNASTSAGDRVWPKGHVPTGAIFPYIAYQRINNSHVRHQSGGSGLAEPRYQIDCYGDRFSTADTLGSEVRELLDNFTGTLGSGDVTASVEIAYLDNDFSDEEPATDNSQIGRYVERLDFIINHRETTTPVS